MASVDPLLPYIKLGWVGVEIGVQWGISSLALLRHGVRFLYLVDPWAKYDGYGDVTGPEWDRIEEENFQECRSRLREYDDGRHFTILRMKSAEAFRFVPPSVDFVWIDGNHSYEYVKKDLELYWWKVKLGGILCGHDYAEHTPCEVREAVHDFVAARGLDLEKLTPCWLVRK